MIKKQMTGGGKGDIAVLEKVNEYMDLLYESDVEHQNKGASQILELAQVILIIINFLIN
jgi:hypothetical protein